MHNKYASRVSPDTELVLCDAPCKGWLLAKKISRNPAALSAHTAEKKNKLLSFLNRHPPLLLPVHAAMHEIITLQLGQLANYVGTHFWNVQVSRSPNHLTAETEAEAEKLTPVNRRSLTSRTTTTTTPPSSITMCISARASVLMARIPSPLERCSTT